MSAEVIDGKAIAADLRERGSPRWSRRRRAQARAGHGPRRRGPGLARLRRQQAQGLRGGGNPLDPPRAAPPTSRQAELVDLVAEPRRDPEVDGILVQLPLPEGLDRDPVLAEISPGKDVDGLTAGQRRAARAGPDRRRRGARARAGRARRSASIPCTPAGVRRAAAPLRRRARGRRGGDRRPLDPRRPAAGEPAARRRRHRHRLSLAHPRPRRGLPPRRRPRRRGRQAGDGQGRIGSSPARP